jgi:hypothetical protein
MTWPDCLAVVWILAALVAVLLFDKWIHDR